MPPIYTDQVVISLCYLIFCHATEKGSCKARGERVEVCVISGGQTSLHTPLCLILAGFSIATAETQKFRHPPRPTLFLIFSRIRIMYWWPLDWLVQASFPKRGIMTENRRLFVTFWGCVCLWYHDSADRSGVPVRVCLLCAGEDPCPDCRNKPTGKKKGCLWWCKKKRRKVNC